MARIVVAGAIVLGTALPAGAQDLRISASGQVRFDDNLLRLPDEDKDAQPRDGHDMVSYAALDARYANQLGLLALDVGANVGQRIFLYNSRLDVLDYGATTHAAYVTPRLSVNLLGEHRRRPISFDDIRTALNLKQDLTRVDLDASRDVLGYVRLVGRASYIRSRTSGGLIQRNDNDTTTLGGGMGYFSPTGNYLTLEYLDATANALTDNEIDVPGGTIVYRPNSRQRAVVSRIKYAPTALTTLQGSIGYSKHDDRSVLDADFSGLIADAAIVWMPRPNVTITPSIRRSFSSDTQLFSNGVQVTTFGIAASAVVAPRLSVTPRMSREKRRFRYDLQRDDPLAFGRRETTTRLGLGLSYETGSKITVTVGYDRISRTATIDAFSFTDNAITVGLSRSVLSL